MKMRKRQSPKATLQTIRDIEAEWSFHQVPKSELQACVEWEFWREAYSLDENVRKEVARFRREQGENGDKAFSDPEDALNSLQALASYPEKVWPQKPFLHETKTVRLRAWNSQKQSNAKRESQERNRPRERWEQMNDLQQSLHWFCPPRFLTQNCPCDDILGESCGCALFLSDWRKLPSGKTIVADSFFDEDRKFRAVITALRIDLVKRDTAIVKEFKQWLKQFRNEVAPFCGFKTGPSEAGKFKKVDGRMRLLKGLGAIRLQGKIGSFERIFEAFSLSEEASHLYESGGLPAGNYKSWNGFVRSAEAFLSDLVKKVQPKSSLLNLIKRGGG